MNLLGARCPVGTPMLVIIRILLVNLETYTISVWPPGATVRHAPVFRETGRHSRPTSRSSEASVYVNIPNENPWAQPESSLPRKGTSRNSSIRSWIQLSLWSSNAPTAGLFPAKARIMKSSSWLRKPGRWCVHALGVIMLGRRPLPSTKFLLRTSAGSWRVLKFVCCDIASITKEFTAAAVLLLYEQKKFALSDPIGKYVPNLPDLWPSATIPLAQRQKTPGEEVLTFQRLEPKSPFI